ncbi:MAG: hypothetical protein AABX54_04300 [Nanoarchaeota archaeon]
MENEEYIKRYNTEKGKLERYLNGKNFDMDSIGDSSEFVSSLVEMVWLLEQGVERAKTGSLEDSAKIIALAKRKKDGVYIKLMRLFGAQTDSEMFSIMTDEKAKIFRDYVMAQYDNSVKRCEELLEAA